MISNMEKRNIVFKLIHQWLTLLMELADKVLNMVLQNLLLEEQMAV